MNVYDLIAITILVLAIVLGFRSGAVPQVGGLLGAIGGVVFAAAVVPIAIGFLPDMEPTHRALGVLIALLAAVGLGEALGSAVGRRAAARMGDGFAAAADDVLGGFVGFAQGVLIVWLTGGVLAAGAVPPLTGVAQTSTAMRTMARLLPPPTQLASELGRLLDASGLPDVFVGLEPIPAAPVDVPDDTSAVAIAGAAVRSTVKVSAAACGVQSQGTGFAIAGEYVVTNAHVIAGARTIRVTLSGRLVDATPVLFDGDLDVAVLYAPRLGAAGLRFATVEPTRGTVAAALGFPGGGSLSIVPAAISGRYDAEGLDLTGTRPVVRRILELRAEIERGDSGGPLILADGTVGGVIFAESRVDPSVGYALSSAEVATRVAPAVGRAGAVPTGACIR
ncbi:MAG: MarP family serine protease [Chloroflexota bacterium]